MDEGKAKAFPRVVPAIRQRMVSRRCNFRFSRRLRVKVRHLKLRNKFTRGRMTVPRERK
jgi:hypothetical protein